MERFIIEKEKVRKTRKSSKQEKIKKSLSQIEKTEEKMELVGDFLKWAAKTIPPPSKFYSKDIYLIDWEK